MNWYKLDAQEQRELSQLGWAPPRPAKGYRPDGSEIVINGDVGEDFLFMHRRMIQAVNAAAEAVDDPWRVDGWIDCPEPDDLVWPVPPDYQMPGQPEFSSFINDLKTDDYYNNVIVPEEDWLRDDDNLRTLTLGELGVRLEFGIHTWFHLRFSEENSVGYRSQSTHPTLYIEEKWDDPAYDYLADFYSAHVNPYFWKIHGWIENKMAAWQAANNVDNIIWVATWEGGPMDVLEELNQVAADAVDREYAQPEENDNHRLAVAAVVVSSVLCGVAIIAVFAICVHKCVSKKKGHSYKAPAQETQA